MCQVTTNYSRFADSEGVFVPTSLTIGYDTPWRQVQRSCCWRRGERRGCAPSRSRSCGRRRSRISTCQYTLLVCLETPQQRSPTLDALHANILDAFNEYGVQITSPNYEADPEGRKIVPVDQWYAAPAGPADAVAEQVRR